MPTIPQLPVAEAVSAADLVPISQGGSVHAVSVGALLAQTQPAIIVGPPSLLGRFSLGAGGPDVIAIGSGLTLNSGTLSAGNFDPTILPAQTSLSPDDQIIVNTEGILQVIGLSQVRQLFTAGSNIDINSSGVISASSLGSTSTSGLTGLPSIGAISSGDLVAVSQGGQDHTITYSDFIDGITIDQVQAAGQASDADTFWVAQAGNIMLRQTLGALWPWVSGKLPTWRRLIVELSTNTALNGTLHNNAVLVCSNSVWISGLAVNVGSGFSCELINASSGPVTLADSIVTSNGSSIVLPLQWATIYSISYSGGSTIFASISTGGSATATPGAVTNISASPIDSTNILLSWSAPTVGGAVSAYSVQYRITGMTSWISVIQNSSATGLTVPGLQPATNYTFEISASNNMGSGPASLPMTALTLASGSLPGMPTGVVTTGITSNSMGCSWGAPIAGGAGIVYEVQYRISGQSIWIVGATNLPATIFNITGLSPSTSYDIQITASDSIGSGQPSTLLVAQTAQLSGQATSITWNLTPSGSFSHGVGAVGLNVHVNPATTQVQFGFSTSATVMPTIWTASIAVNSDIWGAYVPTPTTAGTWFAWAEGMDGSVPTVFATPFTVT
jgi:Fibronectin type III domain